ncbi:hypothetical protein CBP51_00305 [Cellvibrio mixtus]|uniref:Uncharacterized protein n=1 Tax=Cellvibrio mixtus TaxID=39650 RepID=A0A266Q6R8_9GAMM|nr:hypothetical protein [Cellvibrio mixtus]OZY85530.1 hypothetical protein CBP51_00305 [Cellvibrio mixtus]
MAITKIKFITIVGARGGNLSNVDLELTLQGSNWESVSGQHPGAVKETLITLSDPVSISEFNFNLFDIYVSSMSASSAWLLLESVYIVDASPGSPNQLLLGIPNWPKNLWLCSEPKSISAGYVVTACNLGVIANMV